MGHLIELETSKGRELTLTGRGVILTEKLAQLYDVDLGDKLKAFNLGAHDYVS